MRLRSLTLSTTNESLNKKIINALKKDLAKLPFKILFLQKNIGTGFNQYLGFETNDSFGYNGQPSLFYGESAVLKLQTYCVRFTGDLGAELFVSFLSNFLKEEAAGDVDKISLTSVHFSLPFENLSYSSKEELLAKFKSAVETTEKNVELSEKQRKELTIGKDSLVIGKKSSEVSVDVSIEKSGVLVMPVINAKVSGTTSTKFGEVLIKQELFKNNLDYFFGSLAGHFKTKISPYKNEEFISLLLNKVTEFKIVETNFLKSSSKISLTPSNTYIKRSFSGIYNKLEQILPGKNAETAVSNTLLLEFIKKVALLYKSLNDTKVPLNEQPEFKQLHKVLLEINLLDSTKGTIRPVIVEALKTLSKGNIVSEQDLKENIVSEQDSK